MPAPTPRRFYDISGFAIGASLFSSIKSVSYVQGFTRLASAGDADGATSFQARGAEDNSVTITLEDGVQAEAIMAAAVGNLTFVGKTSGTATTKTVTVKNFQGFSRTGNDEFDKVGGIRITGHGFDPTGVGPIVTEADTA